MASSRNPASCIRKADKEEAQGILQSLRTEIRTSLDQSESMIGGILDKLNPGEGVDVTLSVQADLFVIYITLIPRFVLIRDDDLCFHIVIAYGAAKSFILAVRYKNFLLSEFAHAKERFQEQEIRRAKQSVCDCGAVVKERWENARFHARKALNLLDNV